MVSLGWPYPEKHFSRLDPSATPRHPKHLDPAQCFPWPCPMPRRRGVQELCKLVVGGMALPVWMGFSPGINSSSLFSTGVRCLQEEGCRSVSCDSDVQPWADDWAALLFSPICSYLVTRFPCYWVTPPKITHAFSAGPELLSQHDQQPNFLWSQWHRRGAQAPLCLQQSIEVLLKLPFQTTPFPWRCPWPDPTWLSPSGKPSQANKVLLSPSSNSCSLSPR